MLVHGVAGRFDVPDVLATMVDAGISVVVAAPRGSFANFRYTQERLAEMFAVPIAAAEQSSGDFSVLREASASVAIDIACGSEVVD
mmetsp:Transcript_58083/g.189107  ORF Transcript_58083/g.189107 Transcript_58083/m.189107 type:complete len:86 (+) Transcript_58083:1859-2116(+)